MKLKYSLCLLLILSFINSIFAQENKANTDLICVANFLKRKGAMNLEDYNKLINNRQSISHLGTIIAMDHKDSYFHFFDSGSFFIESIENKKTLFDGVWKCLNNNDFKVQAPSVTNKDVLYYNSETEEMTIRKDQSQSASNINNEKSDSKNKVNDSGGWTREFIKDESVFADFYDKPEKPSPSNNAKSNKAPTQWASKFGEEVLSKIDLDKLNKDATKAVSDGLSGKRGTSKNCIYCKGSGVVKVCPICNKTGKKYCRQCGGRRYLPDGKTCLTCAGRGIVTCDGCKGKIYNIKCTHNIFQFQY